MGQFVMGLFFYKKKQSIQRFFKNHSPWPSVLGVYDIGKKKQRCFAWAKHPIVEYCSVVISVCVADMEEEDNVREWLLPFVFFVLFFVFVVEF